MTSSSRNRRSLTTVNSSTSRLRRSVRAELSSAAGRSNAIRTSTTAASRTQARVDEITSAKKLSDTHSGRVLHRTSLRGPRAKGSAVVTTAATAPARRRCERGGGDGGFSVTLAGPSFISPAMSRRPPRLWLFTSPDPPAAPPTPATSRLFVPFSRFAPVVVHSA